MTDRPIIFSAPMVQALLAGQKTQTRRLIKNTGGHLPERVENWSGDTAYWAVFDGDREAYRVPVRYDIGDRLWVREAFRGAKEYDAQPPSKWGNKPIWYCADGTPDAAPWWYLSDRARPSIHMPRWASRLTLTVTDVRVQRLQEISEEDARAEGIMPTQRGGFYWHDFPRDEIREWGINPFVEAKGAFWALWNLIHGSGAWDTNPEVVSLTFTVERRNIDATAPMEAAHGAA